MSGKKGSIAWNKGLTKETDERVSRISESNKGGVPWNKGKRGVQTAWNKGLTKETDGRVVKYAMKMSETKRQLFQNGKVVWNKGLTKEVDERVARNARSMSKTLSDGRRAGENGSNWLGGKSFEPYAPEFNGQLKAVIRERDGYQCQFCGRVEEQSSEKLSINHINYNKKDCRTRNLITLCRSCNGKANFSRDKWQFLFETLQEVRVMQCI